MKTDDRCLVRRVSLFWFKFFAHQTNQRNNNHCQIDTAGRHQTFYVSGAHSSLKPGRALAATASSMEYLFLVGVVG